MVHLYLPCPINKDNSQNMNKVNFSLLDLFRNATDVLFNLAQKRKKRLFKFDSNSKMKCDLNKYHIEYCTNSE